MKRLFAFIAASILCFNLYAFDNISSSHLFDGEEVIVRPDTIHLFFHGCSPHGEFIYITNNSSEQLIINRFYSDAFRLECLYEGENVNEEGMMVGIGETVELQIFASVIYKNELDFYGNLYIDTDFGIYTVTIYHENYLSVAEQQIDLEVYPNPADDHVTIKVAGHDKVSIFNTLGQKVDEFAPEHGEIIIPTCNYPSGVYLVKTDGQTKRFIIAH